MSKHTDMLGRLVTCGTTLKQVNNIKIKRDREWVYHCVSPDGRCLETFLGFGEARDWCEQTLDFTSRKAKKEREA